MYKCVFVILVNVLCGYCKYCVVLDLVMYIFCGYCMYVLVNMFGDVELGGYSWYCSEFMSEVKDFVE